MKTIYFFLILIFSVMVSYHAYGHKVYLFAWVEGDVVHTDSYFPSKKKVIGGSIEVFDPAGNKLLEGKTDDHGSFIFKIPKRTDLRIVLDATMGHKTEFLLPAEEMSGRVSLKDVETDEKAGEAGGAGKRDKPEHTATLSNRQVDLQQLKIMFEKTLDSRLRPIERKIAGLQKEKEPGFTDILSGIGYILGLMGVVLYFKSKRKR